MSENKSSDKPVTPVLKILNQIKNGMISLENDPLSTDLRVECVEYLWMTEAQPVAVMAQLLHVNEKTIRRDKDEIRARNAEKLTPEETIKLLGEFTGKLTETTENLMRLARDNKGSVQEKAQAGMYAYKAIEGQIAVLQKLGYAPSKPLQIEADVHHHQEEEFSVDQLKSELAELEKMAENKARKDPAITKLIETAKHQLALAEAKNTVVELKNRISQPQGNSGEQGQ
jgi:hypothetical protein